MNSITKKIILILLVIGLGFGVVSGRNYYNERYVGKNYYLQVPEDQDTKLDKLLDNNGKVVDKGKEYRLIGFDKDGNKRELDIIIRGKEEDLLQPGEYLRVEASKQIVLGQERIGRDEVPKKALEKIENK